MPNHPLPLGSARATYPRNPPPVRTDPAGQLNVPGLFTLLVNEKMCIRAEKFACRQITETLNVAFVNPLIAVTVQVSEADG